MKFTLRPASLVTVFFLVLVIGFLIYAAVNQTDDSAKSQKVKGGDAAVTNIWLHNYSKIQNLKNNNITYLIVDIGGIESNGKLTSSFTEIESFLNQIRYFEEKEHYDFIILPYSEIDTYAINTSSPEFKKNFLMANKNLVAMGFDGVFLDFEPVRFEQRNDFLDLIDQLRAELPSNSIISVYSGFWSYGDNNEWEWSYLYLLKVAQKADIVSFPGYDTGLSTDAEYIKYVNKQVKKVNQWYQNYNFWFGVPTHKDGPETSKNALLTFNSAINSTKKTPFIGVAVFSEWTADAQDWKTIKKYRYRVWT